MSELETAYVNDVWNLNAPSFIEDKSTSSFKKSEFRPTQGDVSTQTTGIRIDTNNKVDYFKFSEAYLEVNFTNTVAGSAIAVTDTDMAMPNGWALFKNAKLILENNTVCDVNRPGHTAAVMNLVGQSGDFSQSVATNEMFYPMITNTPQLNATTHGSVFRWNGAFDAAVSNNTTGEAGLFTHPLYRGAGATISGNTASAVVGDKYWTPYFDRESPIQQEITVTTVDGGVNASAASYTGRVRANPDYDPNFVASNKRLTADTTKKIFLPLKTIFPILSEVFSTVCRGTRFEITLDKNDNVNEVFYSTRYTESSTAPTFTITKVSLWVPILTPSVPTRAMIEPILNRNEVIVHKYSNIQYYPHLDLSTSMITDVRHRLATQSGKLTKVFVAFQLSQRRTSLKHYSLQFEPLSVTSIEVLVNGDKYPAEYYKPADVPVRVLYDLYATAGKINDTDSGSFIDYKRFADGPCRIYCIDLSHNEPSSFASANISDIHLVYTMSGSPPSAYDCLVWTVSESELKVKMLEGKMEVIKK